MKRKSKKLDEREVMIENQYAYVLVRIIIPVLLWTAIHSMSVALYRPINSKIFAINNTIPFIQTNAGVNTVSPEDLNLVFRFMALHGLHESTLQIVTALLVSILISTLFIRRFNLAKFSLYIMLAAWGIFLTIHQVFYHIVDKEAFLQVDFTSLQPHTEAMFYFLIEPFNFRAIVFCLVVGLVCVYHWSGVELVNYVKFVKDFSKKVAVKFNS